MPGRCLAAAIRWGCLATLLGAPAAFAQARVEVEVDAVVVRVSAEIATSVDRATAWAVLTDYSHWADFVPGLSVSRVVSGPGEPTRVEQRGMVPWLPNFPLVVIAQVEESPPRQIRFERVAGNIRALRGEWRIEGERAVRLLYRSAVIPGFPLPAQANAEIFRNDAKSMLEAMAREMARRARVSGSASGHKSRAAPAALGGRLSSDAGAPRR